MTALRALITQILADAPGALAKEIRLVAGLDSRSSRRTADILAAARGRAEMHERYAAALRRIEQACEQELQLDAAPAEGTNP